MRRNFSILLALPAAHALSLANFQSISLTSIPLLCQLTYDSQIPSCQVSDFNTGCTPACVAGLNSIAADVISACDGTHVTSNSLLGIIQSGGIQAALCPTLAKSTTTTKAKTTSAAQVSTTPAVVSVTIPTDSIGVTGGLGFKTSSTAVKTTSATRASTTASVKSNSKTVQSTSTADSSTPSETSSSDDSAATNGGQTTFTTTTSAKGSIQTSSSSSKAQTTTKAQSNTGVSGGGSPFDIQSNADRMAGKSVFGLVILAAWTVVLLGR